MRTLLNLMLKVLEVAENNEAEVPLSEDESAVLANFEKRTLERAQEQILDELRRKKTKGGDKNGNNEQNAA
jgi:hypothetical protein